MRKTLNRVVGGIQCVAVVVGMLAVLHEFWVQRPKDRDIRNAQLYAAVATLADSKEVEVTEYAVHKVMALMHREGVDMTGISFPNVSCYMAAFNGVDWSDAYMRKVKFVCTDRVNYLIREYDDTAKKLDFCAKLKGARFSGGILRGVRFEYSDLAGAEFSDAELGEVRIDNSVLSGANFSRARMSGIRIKNSDFSVANISGVRFKNVQFKNVIFSDEQIEARRFDQVSRANLNRGRVTTLGLDANETPCTQPWRRELMRWKEKFRSR